MIDAHPEWFKRAVSYEAVGYLLPPCHDEVGQGNGSLVRKMPATREQFT